jgi:YebC/PmpR family DNA-binding regulatory protein
MAGHSKWANIQHRKKAQDAKRGKLFTKLIREITVAARQGGSDAGSNARLRAAVDKALQANMGRDTVERAIKRGAGELDGESYEEVRYEGYGPGGVAVMVDCMTDNRNRTVADIRHAFAKAGGSLGTDGSVAYQFASIGVLFFAPDTDADELFEAALESGADDVVPVEGGTEVLTAAEAVGDVDKAMAAAGFKSEFAETTMRSDTFVSLDADKSRSVLRLMEMLEDLDDVQDVYSNSEFAEEVLAELA